MYSYRGAGSLGEEDRVRSLISCVERTGNCWTGTEDENENEEYTSSREGLGWAGVFVHAAEERDKYESIKKPRDQLQSRIATEKLQCLSVKHIHGRT